MLVRNPLAFFSTVVEIQHRCDRIYTKTINVKLLEPVKRITNQKVSHFIAAVIKNVSSPIRVFAAARVQMFVKRGTIEPAKRPRILWKMRRYPIHDDTNTALVQIIDQIAKVVRG